MYMPSIFRENFVDDFFDGMFPVRGHFNRPVQNLMKTDVKDVGDGYELEMEMPGYSKDEIKVELKKGTLTVSAEKNSSKDEKDENNKYVRRERFVGRTQRSFYVGEHVTQDDIKASFKDGILCIGFPKESAKQEAEENHLIEIL